MFWRGDVVSKCTWWEEQGRCQVLFEFPWRISLILWGQEKKHFVSYTFFQGTSVEFLFYLLFRDQPWETHIFYLRMRRGEWSFFAQYFFTEFLCVAKFPCRAEACQSSHNKCMIELNYSPSPVVLEPFAPPMLPGGRFVFGDLFADRMIPNNNSQAYTCNRGQK